MTTRRSPRGEAKPSQCPPATGSPGRGKSRGWSGERQGPARAEERPRPAQDEGPQTASSRGSSGTGTSTLHGLKPHPQRKAGGRQVGTELLIPRPDLRRGPRAAPEHVPTLKHHGPQTITAATDRQESDVARGTNSHL